AAERDLLDARLLLRSARAEQHELVVLALGIGGHETSVLRLVRDLQPDDAGIEVPQLLKILRVNANMAKFLDPHNVVYCDTLNLPICRSGSGGPQGPPEPELKQKSSEQHAGIGNL